MALKDLLDMLSCKQEMDTECVCLEKLPLAYAYVPYQKMMKNTYAMGESLNRGTAFPELDKPYSVYGKEFKKNGGVREL